MAFTQDDVLRMVSLLGECRASQIQMQLTDRSGREESFWKIFVCLTRLEEAGDIIGRTGDPDPDRGNRRPRYYRISDSGRGKLVEAARRATTIGLQEITQTGAIPQT